MVAIAPFRALRYNPRVIGSFSAVVAPPYDVISPEQQDQLYDASPYNVVRLILGKEFPEDTRTANRYIRAKETFELWCKTGILVRDTTPAVYLYDHAFTWQGESFRRLGFVALLAFEGSVPDRVLRHEATFEGPKADRTRLLEAVHAHLSPIFCIVPDPSQTIQRLLHQASTSRTPLAAFRVRDEEVRVWAVPDVEFIQRLQQHVAPLSVLVADGHHRFEVALSKRQLCPAVMSYFACLEDPAVLVQPIHRVIRITDDAKATWDSRLQSLCTLRPASSLQELTTWLETPEGQGRFGYYEQGRLYAVSLHEHIVAQWLLRPLVPLAIANLDVTILHHVLIPQLIETPPSTNHLVRYTAEASHAIAMVDRREGDCAWLLRPIPLPQVFALASQGFTLPQKSTYFYPKVLSGLFINPFD
jgi:uncharacterized protein (DUF1015 family)